MPTVPKRSSERHGHRTKAEQERVDSSATGSPAVSWPEPDGAWHPVVMAWFRSLQESGQAVWYEPSDVAAAVFVAEAMDKNLRAAKGKFSAMLFTAVWSAMGDLLTTEGSRRRLRVELEKAPDEPDQEQTAAVASLADARARLSVSS